MRDRAPPVKSRVQLFLKPLYIFLGGDKRASQVSYSETTIGTAVVVIAHFGHSHCVVCLRGQASQPLQLRNHPIPTIVSFAVTTIVLAHTIFSSGQVVHIFGKTSFWMGRI